MKAERSRRRSADHLRVGCSLKVRSRPELKLFIPACWHLVQVGRYSLRQEMEKGRQEAGVDESSTDERK